MIDSKPVQPSYLNLIPLKNFSIKESESIVRSIGKGAEGHGSSKNHNELSDPLKAVNTSAINWERMLDEDLDEMMKENLKQ